MPNKKKPSISMIVPVYNEKDAVVSTIETLLLLKEKLLDRDYEIIIVDDGSIDGTGERLKGRRDITLLTQVENKGYGAAIKTGIRNSEGDFVCITDADSTYPNHKIPELIELMDAENHDMVTGSRTGDNVHIPFLRKFAKFFITKLANYVSGSKIPDLNSGLRVMKRSVLEQYIKLLPDGFSLTTTITLAMLVNGYSIKYLPIDYMKREGLSKIRPIRDTLNFIMLIIRMALYFNPLKVFLPMSIFLALSSVLVLVVSKYAFGTIMDVTFGVVLMASIIVLAIGMLADLIVKRL